MQLDEFAFKIPEEINPVKFQSMDFM